MDVEESAELQTWMHALEHDGPAFATIFLMHRDRVFRHALFLAGSISDAEDITAAAFFELWRRRSSVRIVQSSVLPWLLVVASNYARNSQRANARYRKMIESIPRERHLDDLMDSGLSEQLRRALRALSRRDLALILLVAFEDYTPTEAAAALGISPGAARTRLHRVRGRLQGVLVRTDLLQDRLIELEGQP